MELPAGKRVYIEHEGHVFELPNEHGVELVDLGDVGTYVALRAPHDGGLYALRSLEESENSDTVVVHIGRPLSEHSIGSLSPGMAIGPVTGYPFPSVE